MSECYHCYEGNDNHPIKDKTMDAKDLTFGIEIETIAPTAP